MFVNGFPLRCPHCGGENFERTRVTLDSSRSSFLGLDLAHENVGAFTCQTCGRMEWFREAHSSDSDPGSSVDCIRCGTLIPASPRACPNCGELK